MNTANTEISRVLTAQQMRPLFGNIPFFTFPGIDMPTIDIIHSKTENLETEKLKIPQEIDIIELAKRFYLDHKDILLKKYKGKYIAILNNKVIGLDRDFSKLAQRIYKKYGYQTIYMPFVDTKEKVVKIPSPRIKIL